MATQKVVVKRPVMEVAEVAKLLRRCEKWVYVNKHKIPGFFPIAGSVLFNRKTLEKHIEGFIPKPPTSNELDGSSNRHGI